MYFQLKYAPFFFFIKDKRNGLCVLCVKHESLSVNSLLRSEVNQKSDEGGQTGLYGHSSGECVNLLPERR